MITFLPSFLPCSLYIGLGVSLPLITCITVTLVTLYCCWVYRGRIKSRRLAESVQLQQQEWRSQLRQDEQIGDAPPAYTPLADEEVNTLPLYTPEDPYSTQTTPTVINDNDTQLSPTGSCNDETQLLINSTSTIQ